MNGSSPRMEVFYKMRASICVCDTTILAKVQSGSLTKLSMEAIVRNRMKFCMKLRDILLMRIIRYDIVTEDSTSASITPLSRLLDSSVSDRLKDDKLIAFFNPEQTWKRYPPTSLLDSTIPYTTSLRSQFTKPASIRIVFKLAVTESKSQIPTAVLVYKSSTASNHCISADGNDEIDRTFRDRSF